MYEWSVLSVVGYAKCQLVVLFLPVGPMSEIREDYHGSLPDISEL